MEWPAHCRGPIAVKAVSSGSVDMLTAKSSISPRWFLILVVACASLCMAPAVASDVCASVLPIIAKRYGLTPILDWIARPSPSADRA